MNAIKVSLGDGGEQSINEEPSAVEMCTTRKCNFEHLKGKQVQEKRESNALFIYFNIVPESIVSQ